MSEKLISNVVMPDELQTIKSIVDSLVNTFGENCEIVLHDLRYPDKSLIHIAGTITGRKIGAPITDLVLRNLHKYGNEAKDIISYQNRTKDGRVLKSSTIFIRNKKGVIIGCLCINIDITSIEDAIKILETFTLKDRQLSNGELFAQDVNEILQTLVETTAKEVQLKTSHLSKQEILIFIESMYQKGVFNIKGSVDYIANYLKVSKYTIYSYLSEIKNNH